jgi:N-acyl homoserine lactone hydrolase
MAAIDVLLGGFFGKSNRGYLGWSGCYLATTPSGRRLLFDTAGYNERGMLVQLLAERGVAPQQIDCVVLSHLHFDHAANWDLFPGAEIVVHKEELAYAQSPEADGAILRYPVSTLRAHRRLRVIGGENEMLEEGIGILHVPGHTPGAIALALGDTVLCGDALKSRWDLRGHLGPPCWNLSCAKSSIEKLSRIGERLYPGHDSPLERRGSEWHPTGTPSVKVIFPDGSERVIEAPAL